MLTGMAITRSGNEAAQRAREPVYVTGIGTFLAGASNANEFWQNLYHGNSQIDFLTRYQSSGIPVHIAAEMKDFDYRKHLPDLDEKYAAKYTREILVMMSAVEQAREDAGLNRDTVDPRRVGLISSSSRGPTGWWEQALTHSEESGDGAARDFFQDKTALLRSLPGTPSTMSAIYSDIQGLVTTVSNACVGVHQAIGLAMDHLRAGSADMVLVAGHDFPIVRSVARLYLSLGDGVLTAEEKDPATAMKPYNRDRDGFAFGEGAVVLCLERASSAEARGATPYAEVHAGRSMNEADHPTTMDLTGHRTAGLIEELVGDSGHTPDDIDYVCGHGTATGYNDIAESRALKALYPRRDAADLPPISSNKPIYGHCMGISGAVNVAATSMMLHQQKLAPTMNFTDPDPECDHDHVGQVGRPADVDLAVSLSFAFGSQTSVVALGAVS